MATLAYHRWISSVLVITGLACVATETRVQRGARDWDTERRRMVDEQLRARDIRSARVLDTTLKVPRHLFVPEPQRTEAYSDSPLPIGHDQTISQPYIVAFMTQALDVAPGHRVLEVGTGSGYQAAILGALAKDVYRSRLWHRWQSGHAKHFRPSAIATFRCAPAMGIWDGPSTRLYDRIMVTAAPDEGPTALLQQLKLGGLIVIPVGTMTQELRILRRTATGTETLGTLPVRFVPMTNKPGG